LQKVRRDGGLETARHLLRQPGVSKGFIGLWKAARLDLSVEYLVLWSEYAPSSGTPSERLRISDSSTTA
jgi:hypothetical protein